MHFDAVTSLSYGETDNKITTLNYAKVLEDKVLYGGQFSIPSPIDEAIMLLLHGVFDKKSLSEYSDTIIETLNREGIIRCIRRILSLSILIQ